MVNEKRGAIGLLFIFLVITAGVLAYSLPSNVYSPQKGSVTEISLMDYSNDTNILFLISHIFLNSPKPTDVTVTGVAPYGISTTQPSADISDGSARWEGVFSKRSQLYFEDEKYTSLYYEAHVPFENPISVTLEFEDDVVSANIVNAGDIPVEDIFVSYNDGGQRMQFSGHLPTINANASSVLQMDAQYLDNYNLINVMENAGISDYAAQFLFGSETYDRRNILFVPGAYDRTWAMVTYRLPESLYDDVMPITITSSPTKLQRFGWVSLNLDNVPVRSIENPGITSTINIYDEHHHLGDDVDPELVPNEPDGVSYSTTFTTDLASNAAKLVVTTRNVMPHNPPMEQFRANVYINGDYIGNLNDHVINETQDYVPRTVSISFDPYLLNPFDNTIKITSERNLNGTNYDDFEIFDLKIILYSEKPMALPIPEPIPEYYLR